MLIVDVEADGICSAGRKLIRTLSLELDTGALVDKDFRFGALLTAMSSSSRSSLEKHGSAIPAALARVGMTALQEGFHVNVEEEIDARVEELAGALEQFLHAQAQAAAPKALHALGTTAIKILCAGAEALEAGEALATHWSANAGPGAGRTVEEASLALLLASAQQRNSLVLVVDCEVDGSLSSAGRGLLAQLSAAPLAIKAQLRQLRFAFLAVAKTDYGNAGERASAQGALTELTLAAAPVSQALAKAGAVCLASEVLQLQATESEKMAEIAAALRKSFEAAPSQRSSATATASTPILQMAALGSQLPPEADAEPSDVVARFYFEAERTKVLKVTQLRQQPNLQQGLSTVEVEIEACGSLKDYSAGGTLSLLPENDAQDVAAMLPLLGHSSSDLDRQITLSARNPSQKVKKPFPTPCTLREALSCYCDLQRPPSKKMLAAMQPKLPPEVQERVGKLLADDTLKLLQTSACCVKMHEFWQLLGVEAGGIDAGDFLLHCPRQRAREFTIASSPKASPGKISLCVSLTSHEAEAFSSLTALSLSPRAFSRTSGESESEA